MHDQLGKLSGLLRDFSNAGRRIFPDLHIHIFQAIQDPWEDFGLNDNFSKVHSVFGDLGQALANISLELSIWVRNQGSKVGAAP